MPEIAFEMRRTLKVKKADAPKHCDPLNKISGIFIRLAMNFLSYSFFLN